MRSDFEQAKNMHWNIHQMIETDSTDHLVTLCWLT